MVAHTHDAESVYVRYAQSFDYMILRAYERLSAINTLLTVLIVVEVRRGHTLCSGNAVEKGAAHSHAIACLASAICGGNPSHPQSHLTHVVHRRLV